MCIHFHRDLVLNFRGKIESEVQNSISVCGHNLLKLCIAWWEWTSVFHFILHSFVAYITREHTCIVSCNIQSTMQSWWIECYAVSPHVFIVTAVVFNFTIFSVTKIASLFCSNHMKFFIYRDNFFFKTFLNYVPR